MIDMAQLLERNRRATVNYIDFWHSATVAQPLKSRRRNRSKPSRNRRKSLISLGATIRNQSATVSLPERKVFPGVYRPPELCRGIFSRLGSYYPSPVIRPNDLTSASSGRCGEH